VRGVYSRSLVRRAVSAPLVVVGYTDQKLEDAVDRDALKKMFPSWPNITKRHDAITPSSGGGDPPKDLRPRTGGGGGRGSFTLFGGGGVIAGGALAFAIALLVARAKKGWQ